jgi:hypothetical protein
LGTKSDDREGAAASEGVLECVYGKREQQLPTEVYREFNNVTQLTGREQI